MSYRRVRGLVDAAVWDSSSGVDDICGLCVNVCIRVAQITPRQQTLSTCHNLEHLSAQQSMRPNQTHQCTHKVQNIPLKFGIYWAYHIRYWSYEISWWIIVMTISKKLNSVQRVIISARFFLMTIQNYQRDVLNIIHSSNIITLLYMFRVSGTHLQEDIVVHKQHMVPSLSIRVLVSCWYAAISLYKFV